MKREERTMFATKTTEEKKKCLLCDVSNAYERTHFSKGLSEVLGEAIIQYWIYKTICVGQHMAKNLYGYA